MKGSKRFLVCNPKLRLVTVSFLLVLSRYGYGQPVVIPPSPHSAGMANFINVPVDYYTGVPKINVPIVSLPHRNHDIYVGLAYNARGIRVQDVAGPVGLGWILQAGGVITRVVKGIPDKEGEFWDPNNPDNPFIAQVFFTCA